MALADVSKSLQPVRPPVVAEVRAPPLNIFAAAAADGDVAAVRTHFRQMLDVAAKDKDGISGEIQAKGLLDTEDNAKGIFYSIRARYENLGGWTSRATAIEQIAAFLAQ